jgi:hypothetical protein
MWSIRNIGGVSLLLWGSTFLWLTPGFVTPGLSTDSGWWSVTLVLSLATLAGFTVATWGLFHRATWWERLAVASAVVGTVVLLPYWLAAQDAGEAGGFNIVVHLLGNAAVVALLRVPRWEHWVDAHVAAGR